MASEKSELESSGLLVVMRLHVRSFQTEARDSKRTNGRFGNSMPVAERIRYQKSNQQLEDKSFLMFLCI